MLFVTLGTTFGLAVNTMLNRENDVAVLLYKDGAAAKRAGIPYEANPGVTLPQKRTWAMGYAYGD